MNNYFLLWCGINIKILWVKKSRPYLYYKSISDRIYYIKTLKDYLNNDHLKMERLNFKKERLNFKKERLKFRSVNRCQRGLVHVLKRRSFDNLSYINV